jgi:transcriptional regulator with GAF, ATPase, and Fis domain/tetratricopeptide (TPR) repeat protein
MRLTELLAGRYRPRGTLGAGAQGSVWLARDERTGAAVAIKEVAASRAGLLRNELAILGRLRHPNLCEVLDLIELPEAVFLVQRHAPGASLGLWAARDRSPARISAALAAVARALGYLHRRGVLHRDLKPENVLVEERELAGLPAARLIDFGLAVELGAGQGDGATGTLGYLAPEVMAGGRASPASDRYAFGVLLLEALTGRLPRRELGRLDERELDGAPPALAPILRGLLEVCPEARPPLEAVREGLEATVGRSLAPTLADLCGDLRPTPPLLGREPPLARIARALALASRGEVSWLRLAGCGKSSAAREACLAARVAGARVRSSADLWASRPASQQPARQRSLIVDELLAERARPFLLCLDPLAGEQEEVLLLCAELRRSLEAGGELCGGVVLDAGELPEPRLPGWETVDLPRLDRATSEQLVHEMLAGLETPFWIGEVFPATGGDPRLIVELVHAQLAAGLPDQILAIPDRAGLAAHAVEALAPAEQTTLAAVASTIRPIPFAVLEAVVDDAQRSLELLLRRGLVGVEEAGLVPANRLVAEAAARRGPQGEALRRLHARLAAAILGHAAQEPAWLGHHLLHAGAVEEAAAALARAPDARIDDLRRATDELDPGSPVWSGLLRSLGERQRSSGALDAALATAARLGARLPTEGALLAAELLLAGGQPARALEALAALTREPRSDERVLLLEGRAAVFLGRHLEAARCADELRRRGPGARLEAQAEHLAGLASVYLGAPAEGLAALDRATALARTASDRELEVRAESGRGIALGRLGRRDEAAEAHRRCEAIARELGDLRSAASACLNLGTLAHEGLDLDQAYHCYRRAAALAHRAESGTTRVSALSNEANLLLLFGALPEADDRLARAEEAAHELGALAELGYLALYRAERWLLAGDLDAAEVALEAARASFDPGDATGRDAAALLAGELLARRRRVIKAETVVTELEERTPWRGPERFRVHLLAARVELARPAPALESARRELALALALADRAGVGPLAWEAEALLARCAADLGLAQEAAWHASRFAERVRALEERIPHLLRARFAERPDLRRARDSLRSIVAPPRGEAPSLEDLERLLALNQELNQRLPLAELLNRILDAAIELTGAERGFVLLGEERSLRLSASRNLDGESLRRGMEKLSQTIAWLAIEQGRPILVEDAMQDERFVDRMSVTGLRLRAVLCAPFSVRGGRGALYVDNRFREGAFTQRHLALMHAFAGQAGIAITHAQLVEELSRNARQLGEAKAALEERSRGLEAQLEVQGAELGEIAVRLRAHEEELVRKYNAARIIGRSKAIRQLFASLDRVAEADVPVLIWGESGTGKELVARALHDHSPRRSHPFVTVNCGAIAPTLLESELFGHARGAFTGATRDRPGLFEAAGAGTLLLDEVGDMPAEMQVKLLRILQEGSFRRVGEERERRSACRVLSASHRRLDELVTRGAFREDLYYRLQVIQLEVPALRDRLEDIPLLCEHLLGAIRPGLELTPAALAALLDHDWPGNVRQLEHELQRAALLCEGSAIEPEHLSIPIRARRRSRRAAGGLREELRRVERELIQTALREAGGVVADAAEALGLHRVVLYRRMREVGVPAPTTRKPAGKRTR